MATLKQELSFFNDTSGKIRPNAQMFFYEAGTTTQKNTYTDTDLKYANQWPLIADGAGVFPPIFLAAGGYRIIWKDEDGVQFNERDNLNIAETTVLSTSDFYFEDLTKAKLGVSINGSTIDLQIGQVARTMGSNTSTDGEGAEWLVVAGGTGTADDDLFADLDNGNQLQRLLNQLYTKNNLSEISDAGSTAQEEAQTNLGLRDPVPGFVVSTTRYIDENGDSQGDTKSITTEDAWTTIGPTGSGATVIWTALDILPLNAVYAEVSALLDSALGPTDDKLSVALKFRATGTAVDPEYFAINFIDANADIFDQGQGAGYTPIVLDSANTFEFLFTNQSFTENSIIATLSLIGFGV